MSAPLTRGSPPVRPPAVVSPAPRGAWRELLGADPEAVVTQTPAWLDCVCTAGGYVDASRLYEFGGGRRFVLPLVRREGRPATLTTEASFPSGWGAGGPVSAGGPPSAGEAAGIFSDIVRRPAFGVSVRFAPEAAPEWPAAAAGFSVAGCVTYSLALDGGFGRVWQNRFRGGVRRAVRKAERADLDIEVDRAGRLLSDFWRLYEQSIDRWARQQHEPLALSRWRAKRANPPEKFVTVADRLGEACAIWMARLGGDPVAAIIVLRQGAHAKYWRGAMNKELATPTRANDLLHRLAIEDACLSGCRDYDMGEARPGASLARFKEGFGALGRVSATYHRERLPISAVEARLRDGVKRAIGFRDP